MCMEVGARIYVRTCTHECKRLRALPSDYRRACMRVREGSGMDIGLGVDGYLPVNFMITNKKGGRGRNVTN